MSSKSNRDDTNRFVIYTALFGDKEPLGDPLAEVPPDAKTDLSIDFICFTDNRGLTSNTWTFRYLDSSMLPPEKFSRRPKALPHEYLPDYDTSLYIDNSVFLKRLPSSDDLKTEMDYLFRLFRHQTRTNIDEEADAIVLLRYEEENRICEQMEHYKRLRAGFVQKDLSTCTVILRNHLHPTLVSFGIAWWEQILAFSKRDQLSFDLCAKLTGATVEYFSQKFNDNDLFRWNSGGNAIRIYPNFDGKRYAWKNRSDPVALRSPRAHCLAHGAWDSPLYSRKVSLLEYICNKFNSSLGSYTSPRRRVARTLGDMLTKFRKCSGKLLVLRIDDPVCSTGFTPEEHLPATQALSTYLGNYQTQHFELPRDTLSTSASLFGPNTPVFEILAILGPAPDDLAILQPLIERLASPSSAAVILLASDAIQISEIARLAGNLSSRLGTTCNLSVGPGDHDELEQSMQNSLAVLEWQSGQA